MRDEVKDLYRVERGSRTASSSRIVWRHGDPVIWTVTRKKADRLGRQASCGGHWSRFFTFPFHARFERTKRHATDLR